MDRCQIHKIMRTCNQLKKELNNSSPRVCIFNSDKANMDLLYDLLYHDFTVICLNELSDNKQVLLNDSDIVIFNLPYKYNLGCKYQYVIDCTGSYNPEYHCKRYYRIMEGE